MARTYDAVIVGAGAIGLSTAFLLTKNEMRVLVIAPRFGQGAATRAAGAMIDAFGEIEKLDTPREVQKLDFEVRAQRRYPTWLAELQEASGRSIFSQEGIAIVANAGGEHDLSKMRLMREKLDEFREPYEELDPKEIVGLVPHPQYRPHDAFLMKSGRCVDTADLIAALEAALELSERADRLDAAATKIEQSGTMWTVHVSDGQALVAPKVVVCAGAHTMRLVPEERLDLPKLYFGRGSSVTVVNGPKMPYTLRTPNRALSCGIHMVPQANDRLYLGATNLFGTDFDNLPTGPTVGELHTLFEAIQNELNTTLRNISIESIHNGLRPVTQNDEPLCGATKLDGLYIATGTHRTGVHMSPLIAAAVSAEVLGQKPDFENPFHPNREHRSNRDINLRLGVRSLIATVLFPTGKLPYNRMEEIETYITELLRLVAYPETTNGDEKEFARILREIPLDEQGVLQTYHSVLERKLPGYGPYPS